MQNDFEDIRVDLIEFLKSKYNNYSGTFDSDLSSLDFYFVTEPTETSNIMYEPSLCLILQGNKEVDFGDKLFYYDQYQYLLVSTHVPAKIRVLEASKEVPYMSLRIKFNMEDIYEVLKDLSHIKFTNSSKSPEKALFFNDMNKKLYEPISRLVKLLDKPKKEMEFFSKLINKEILYILLSDEHSGYFLHKFAMAGSVSNKIINAITEIKSSFNEKLNMKELASKVDMSESSFYQYFKTITSMSPIQFQKKLRLEEAKNMLVTKNAEANEVAFAVGYESPSQFSREYSRVYGMSPKAHSEYLRAL